MRSNHDVDTIVIGSGAGGLTAAVALAQSGQKVLVLEQHYLPGGWCHSFTLEGYKFSPGVHYIGEIQPGGQMRNIYEGLGLGADLEFCEINPDGLDHIITGGERFDIPKGKDAFTERLVRRFPEEAKGIRGYMQTVTSLANELNDMFEISSIGDVLKLPFRARTVLRWGLATAQSMINSHVKHPRLRAILAGQSGDHGLPPSMAPAPVHASVTAHYYNGGYYPRGGASSLPRAYIKALRRHGGEIRVRTGVSKILIENRRAIGVRLDDGTEIRCKNVISNADPAVTYGTLVGEQHLSGKMRRKLAKTQWSCSALSLFMATDLDLRKAGMDSGNYWYYQNDDVEGIYKKGLTSWGSEIGGFPGLFLTGTTLKDPTKLHKGHHTLEAFTFVGYDAYKNWERTKQENRPAEYTAMKNALMKKMISTASRIVPGLEDHVVFADLGTPLTNVFYCAATGGNLYGIEKSRWQVGPWAYPVKSEIEGLTLCGSSTLSHGVMGAAISGLVAAREVAHCRVRDLLRKQPGEIKIFPSEDPASWPDALKRKMTARPAAVDFAVDASA